MRNGLTLFLGVFAALAVSWAAVLLAAHKQLGSLPQFKDPADESLHPAPRSGLAEQGRMVYQDLGCVTCHTQQVRHEGFGNDVGESSRKWGDRGSYARDYLRDKAVLIGQSRLGPDLRNVGSRLGNAHAEEYAEWFYKLLYAPQSVAAGTNMPAYPFLFDVHPVAGRQPSAYAVSLPSRFTPGPGFEVVPTPRAVALVAYLQSLNDAYDYPTERDLNASAPHAEHGEAGKAGAPAEKPKEGAKR